MASSFRACFAIILLLALSVGAVRAPSAEPVEKKTLPTKPSDLTPEQFKELLDELARLREKASKEVRVPPGKLFLKGHVEGNLVFLQAKFEFSTERPNATVALGCKPAYATNARFEPFGGSDPMAKVRQIPNVRPDADGFNVLLDEAEPKGRALTLDLVVALTTQGNVRSFEMKLPRASVTMLELTLPGGAHDVRFVDNPALQLNKSGNEWALGPADKLAINWKQGKAVGTGPKTLEAAGIINVHLDERRAVLIEARLTLRVRNGSTDRWELLVPPGAILTVDPADEARVKKIDDPVPKEFASLRTINLKEASAEPLQVTVVVQPRVSDIRRFPVGPFIVLGAVLQPGTIFVTSKGPEPRLHRHGDTTLREATDDEKKAHKEPFLRVLSYKLVPHPTKPTTAIGPTSYSLLDVEPDAVRGLVKTTTTHTLKMETDPQSDRRQWVVFTKIEAELVNQGTIEQIEVHLPYGHTLSALPGIDVRTIGFLGSLSGQGHLLATSALLAGRITFIPPESRPPPIADVKEEAGKMILKLSGDAWKKFVVTFQVRYPVNVGDKGEYKGESRFELPRVLEPAAGSQTIIDVEAPRDVELMAPERPGLTVLTVVSPHELSWRAKAGTLDADRPPALIDVLWQPYRPEVRAIADVTLTTPGRQAQVRHELHYRFSPSPKWVQPQPVTLQLPKEMLRDTFKIVSGGKLIGEDRQTLSVQLNAVAGEDAVLVLEYSFIQTAEKPGGATTFSVPLAVPEQVTHGETRIRLWSEPGTLPELAEGESAWVRLNIEKVRGKRGQLPVLVLQTQSVDRPLLLRLAEVKGERVTVLVDRALIRVEVQDGKPHHYRASFFLTQLLTRQLDVELPAPVASLDLKMTLGGEVVTPEIVDENGERSARGTVARLRLDPDLVQRTVLEVSYYVPPGRVDGGLFRTVLQSPILRGEPGRVLTLWQVTLPAGWVPLGPEGGASTPRVWNRHGWLFVPRLGVSAAEMDRWFAGNENVPLAPETEGASTPHLICLRSGLGQLTVTHAPFKPWLAGCSLGVLLIGLGLYFLARRAGRGSSGWFWLSLSLLTFSVGGLWLFRPTAMTAVTYGAELGMVVLLVFAVLLWLMHERQRRQIVFLPSFRRGRGGSSILRSGSGSGPVATSPGPASGSGPKPQPNEPSTVDAPRPAASSH